ncbi:hypothetical protein GCM10023149_18120 [Mucilaginibacter gynuensis]|uniref:Alpha-L-rhamnosidase-like protein n=1 Tax=Mucilaginibacter gynuensis TaxID=1302236 RepID=A0ABP8G889_9SPHI
MTRIRRSSVLYLLLLLSAASQAQTALKTGFNNPPSAAKARTWWHWIDGNISKKGITADLEAMKRVGIQEAQIFNVGQGYPDGPYTYLSPEWLDMIKFAGDEAKRLGMELAFHNGPGWSSSGGPWVKPEQSMQTVVYSQSRIKGGSHFHFKLTQPTARFNYYKDIALIAFPTPKGNVLIDKLGLKTLSGDQFLTHLYPDDKVIDPASVIDKTKVLDLSAKMATDGTLDWDAPAGDWTVLRFGHTSTGAQNRPAPKGGLGLEVDKMSSAAMDAYWTDGIKPIIDKLGPLVGTTVNNCLIDSYEVGCGNWTPGFAAEFRKRNAYDLIPYLPTLAGFYVQSGEVSERFLYDYRKTISDLMAKNYWGHFADLCHKVGMKFSTEPYGGPFEALKVGAKSDIVMGEFWIGRNEYIESPKLAASIAHVSGLNIVGTESFTSLGGWVNHPATLKPSGDRVWTEGVNRFIFHTYTHQPWELTPGMTFHQYGLDMNRHNTWWEQSKAYMDYLARSQYLLQTGKSFADVLVFTGETSPNDAMLRPDIKALGYDYDQIGPDQLAKLKARNGKIYDAYGHIYSMLVLPESKWATPELLRKLKELALGGATIIGAKPLRSPGLVGYPNNDAQVKQLSGQLWPAKISADLSVGKALSRLRLAPDFSAGRAGADIKYIHRRTATEDIYFVSNPKTEQRAVTLSFRVSGRQPSLWDSSTGKVEDVLVWNKGDNGTIDVPVSLDPNGSVFVIFSKGSALPQISRVKSDLQYPKAQPLADLKIVKAEYGTFLPDGMGDVTDVINKAVKPEGVYIAAVNNLLPADPAPGSVKELRMDYELDGRRQTLSLVEGQQHDLKFEGKPFKLIRALYGKFTKEFKGVPPKYPVYDVADKVNELINSGQLIFKVTDVLFDAAPTPGIDRELRLSYTTEEDPRDVAIPQGNIAHLEQDIPQPKMLSENKIPLLITPYAGTVTYKSATGISKNVNVKNIPEPVVLTGPWEIGFDKKMGAPASVMFPGLMSWTKSDIDGIKYYSGTAVYKKHVNLTDAMIGKDKMLELDLGSVRVMAEVTLNGHNLGVFWKAPFRVDITDAAKAGDNELEIRVTNLWINRLIGDAQLPDDIS